MKTSKLMAIFVCAFLSSQALADKREGPTMTAQQEMAMKSFDLAVSIWKQRVDDGNDSKDALSGVRRAAAELRKNKIPTTMNIQSMSDAELETVLKEKTQQVARTFYGAGPYVGACIWIATATYFYCKYRGWVSENVPAKPVIIDSTASATN